MSNPNIPHNETLWETITSATGKTYIVTSNKDRSVYYLYKEAKGKLTKYKEANSPINLAKYIK